MISSETNFEFGGIMMFFILSASCREFFTVYFLLKVYDFVRILFNFLLILYVGQFIQFKTGHIGIRCLCTLGIALNVGVHGFIVIVDFFSKLVKIRLQFLIHFLICAAYLFVGLCVISVILFSSKKFRVLFV